VLLNIKYNLIQEADEIIKEQNELIAIAIKKGLS
jgi:hypothetical protein